MTETNEERAETEVATRILRSKGFRVTSSPVGSDYALWSLGDIKHIRDSIVISRDVHLFSLRPDGKMDREVWEGRASSLRRGTVQETLNELLGEILAKFPN